MVQIILLVVQVLKIKIYFIEFLKVASNVWLTCHLYLLLDCAHITLMIMQWLVMLDLMDLTVGFLQRQNLNKLVMLTRGITKEDDIKNSY